MIIVLIHLPIFHPLYSTFWGMEMHNVMSWLKRNSGALTGARMLSCMQLPVCQAFVVVRSLRSCEEEGRPWMPSVM